MSKSKIIGWVIASPFILIAGGIAFCELNKAYWDHQVKLMCEKDGGVTVFEYIELTPDEFKKHGGNQYGEIRINGKSASPKSDPYFIDFSNSIINKGPPQVGKTITSIIRKSDGKTMSVLVDYGRGGGDLIVIDHPSSFSCNEIEGFSSRLIKSTVKIKGE